MNSPFPGMDPFVECYEWSDFHSTFNSVLREMMSPALRPNYIVKVEERVYVERFETTERLLRRPDVTIARTRRPHRPAGGVLVEEQPAGEACVLVYDDEEATETYLVIRKTDTHEVVTVIETLSPANKRPGTDGFDVYCAKRKQVIFSQANFVELDLLRGGQRPPVHVDRKSRDYFALISPARKRPEARIHSWTIRDKMPTISIPLLGEEAVRLDLQQAFDTVYERAGYDLSIDYSAPLEPPLTEDDQAWAREITSPRTPGPSRESQA